MSAFLTKLRFEDDGGLPFTLTDPLEYQSDTTDGLIDVPTGFKTDLASIPRVLWNVLPPVGKYDASAVVHDFLYQIGPNSISRSAADSVLREAMAVCGVSALQRWIIYTGVRVGGWKPWNRYRAAGKTATSVRRESAQ
jgi:hypothetical protein